MIYKDHCSITISFPLQRTVMTYVDSEIVRHTKNGTLRVSDPALQEEIRERLADGAKGM